MLRRSILKAWEGLEDARLPDNLLHCCIHFSLGFVSQHHHGRVPAPQVSPHGLFHSPASLCLGCCGTGDGQCNVLQQRWCVFIPVEDEDMVRGVDGVAPAAVVVGALLNFIVYYTCRDTPPGCTAWSEAP